jgi:hypothetical protein
MVYAPVGRTFQVHIVNAGENTWRGAEPA